MPKTWHRWQRRHVANFMVQGLLIFALAGCATSGKKEDEDGASGQAKPAVSAKGLLAKGGTTVSNDYVDPGLVSAASVAENGAPPDAGPAMAQAQPGFAELVTQPTGIRAGSISIFSGSVATTADPAATATIPATATPGRVNATAGSVFSAPAPAVMPATRSCGTAADGMPLSC
ncbi:hypothetical protein ABID21_001400 [Pseudorhizobium tarimense]|uniref:Lipoprotein n=1 Tax=Pseudorhizobium tarimense TaxID=1079109 RepID=A0ABV2H432_9HYPH|nr:hypothetical protein [Pseudorhizobium tarimense]MCJ8518291.1 hypothetical protein [Pseudorhizobium tarimense]